MKRRTKRYKNKKINKKTKRIKRRNGKKKNKKKMKGGGIVDGVLNFFKPKKPDNVNTDNANPLNTDTAQKANCPKPTSVLENINSFTKDQTAAVLNSIKNANVNIKKSAKQQVERTFNNLMGAMVSKSEKDNVCPCCKRPYTDKEKVIEPKTDDGITDKGINNKDINNKDINNKDINNQNEKKNKENEYNNIKNEYNNIKNENENKNKNKNENENNNEKEDTAEGLNEESKSLIN
jgi:hypothetical protein